MSVSSHLSMLQDKHADLDGKIEDELQHPGSDDLSIAALKREKLRLKDEISRLRKEAH